MKDKLTFTELLKLARELKRFPTTREERRAMLGGLIIGAQYYYVEDKNVAT